MAKFQMVVLTCAADDAVAELARWYDEQHIPDLLRVPGIVSARRGSVMKLGGPAGLPDWNFLACYDIEAESPQLVLAETGRRMGTDEMPRSPALDSSKTLALIITPQFEAEEG
ncbi:DUF4286 family protein [Sphingomonas immobilis]|jgi:hypothetical protein|uniref:YCII-related domain-containing protein n=1 Tax=Sphingomonas immobilis TaxID=3063997 RepID=A0ABT8ZX72_9SPHN|nr:DUF4286 family protein [Sphingomonas sp. CA1-15]MDO7842139.1 hypothetical protein [Sphingomonas sp. CA1-15]